MTYYFLVPEILMVIAFLVDAIVKKEVPAFFKATGAVVVAAVIAVCLNLSNLYHTYEYAKDTMRGKSELVKAHKTEDQTDSGLERSYITAWSYGIDETFTFLIPNYRGGASDVLSHNEDAMKKADPQLSSWNIYNMFTQYWGEQPMTSGPVYLGAIVCMLFILSLILVPNKNPLKWALLLATAITLMLGWGRNFMAFTDFFIDYVPMYAKFRTVSSILVVVEFTVPLLALWGLKLFVENPRIKPLYIATGITVALCLILMFTAGDCLSSHDREAIASAVSSGNIDQMTGQRILASISSMREAMLSADGWRSIIFILLGAACMWFYAKKAEKAKDNQNSKLVTSLSVALLVLCLVDMWQVNKRYLNDDMFVSNTLRTAPVEPTETDRIILQDKSLDYRVLNLASNTFNENETSFFHNSIGGYHAAKLRRYQELIENHIAPEMQAGFNAIAQAQGDMSKVNGDSIIPVINMLNTKYLILPLQEGKTMPLQNPYAMGNAWFVNEVMYVDNANKEIEALGKTDLHTVAIADKSFESVIGKSSVQDSTSTVTLTKYEPNELHYDVNSKNGGVVVFSEIYYPGWSCTVDGQPVEIGRANYVLRAIQVKPGQHKVVMEFRPKSLATTETIAYIALIALFIAVIVSVALSVKKNAKK
jgi:hypothetical protein